MADDDTKRQPELRAYEPSWPDELAYKLTDFLYGPNANAQQGAWAKKLVGPENPFNFPAQITHGGNTAIEGYHQGDPWKMAHGAVEAGLGAALPAYGGARIGAMPFKAYAAHRAAGDAALAAKGPWGNPGMLDQMRDAAPQVPRHEINLPRSMHEIEAYQNQGLPYGLDHHPLTEEQKAANGDYTRKLDQLREGYMNTSPDSTYGQDLAATQEARRPLSYEQMAAQHDALREEAIRHMGIPEETMGPGRWSSLTQKNLADTDYYRALEEADRKSRYGNYGVSSFYKPEFNMSPSEGLASTLRKFGANNENVPGAYEQSIDMADRVRAMDAQHARDRAENWRQHENWDQTVGYGSGKDKGHRYHEDVDRRFAGDDDDFGWMGLNETDRKGLEDVLVNKYGADLRDRQSIQDAYDRMWADEDALRSAGKPTLHDQERQRQEWEQQHWLDERYGRHLSREEQDALAQQDLAGMKDKVRQAREGYEARAAGRGGFDPENNPTMQRVAQGVINYGPPAAIGSYVAHRLGLGERSLENAQPSMRDPNSGLSPQIKAPTPEAPKRQSPAELGANPDSNDYLRYTVNKNRDDAQSDRTWAGGRELIHALGFPLSFLMPGGKWPKVGMAAHNGYWFRDAMNDRHAADDRFQTYDALKKGYTDRLSDLNPDDYPD